jgi:hypothetical protein
MHGVRKSFSGSGFKCFFEQRLQCRPIVVYQERERTDECSLSPRAFEQVMRAAKHCALFHGERAHISEFRDATVNSLQQVCPTIIAAALVEQFAHEKVRSFRSGNANSRYPAHGRSDNELSARVDGWWLERLSYELSHDLTRLSMLSKGPTPLSLTSGC